MFLQRFKYTDHYYIANIWFSRRSARFISCGSKRLEVKKRVKQKNHRHVGMAPNLCSVALVIPSNTVLLAVVMHFL